MRPSPRFAGTSFPADTSRRDDRPPTHFFVKKKFSPAGGAETTTQKVPNVFYRAHTLCGAGSIPHAEGSFFLYEKSVLRESDSLCGREQKVCTDLTPFPALKKMGIQGGPGPLGRARDSVSRSCPSATQRVSAAASVLPGGFGRCPAGEGIPGQRIPDTLPGKSAPAARKR